MQSLGKCAKDTNVNAIPLSPLIKTLIFTILVPGTVGVALPLSLVKTRAQPSSALGALGLLSIALGALIYLRCAWDFAWTGRGTPAPIDAPKILVVKGLYRALRNPMYVGVLLVVAGQAALFRAGGLLEYLAALAVLFHLFIVLHEEPALRRRFGSSYEVYCRRTPRWFPGFRRQK
jgi:protein-S-isoprenylcysteine O-methyltransferase Ste14